MSNQAKAMRVLIVDDNNLIRSILSTLLRQEGYEIIGELAKAQGVVEAVRQMEPDIVCLDYNLPGGNGLDLLCEIHQSFPNVSVIMITGSTDAELMQAAANAGVSAFLHKPFSPDQASREFEHIRHARQMLRGTQFPTPAADAAKPLRALIADDSATMRQLLSAILESMGIVVIAGANDGQQALDLALATQPDLACLDIEMPRLNGLSALAQIKQAQPEMRVVMVTSHAESATVKQALLAGACGYILKPYQPEQVISTLRKILAKAA